MVDQSFPIQELWPYVQPYWPQANAAGVNEALSDYQSARKDGKEGLNVSWNGYASLLQGMWADLGKPKSDSYEAVDGRVGEGKIFRQLAAAQGPGGEHEPRRRLLSALAR